MSKNWIYMGKGPHSGTGKSTIKIRCPYCDATVVAYVWSLAGSGKRCTCGAIHRWQRKESIFVALRGKRGTDEQTW